MKYASAMKYGGELVAAEDCTYDSFKELVPLCPNCKEPVYLRSGGQRESVKGKAYQIGPHWCHFKGISAEQVAGCELRVNGYTEKDRAKIAAQARGQRLKLLQRWFWRVFAGSHESMGFPVREIIAAQKPCYKNYPRANKHSLLENVIFVMTELEVPPINAKLLLENISFAVSQKKCVITTGGVTISTGLQKKFIEQYADNALVLSRLADHSHR